MTTTPKHETDIALTQQRLLALEKEVEELTAKARAQAVRIDALLKAIEEVL